MDMTKFAEIPGNPRKASNFKLFYYPSDPYICGFSVICEDGKTFTVGDTFLSLS